MTDERIFAIIRLLLPFGVRAFIRLTRADGTIGEQELLADTDANFQAVRDRAPAPPPEES
jgi:hypothetical protein